MSSAYYPLGMRQMSASGYNQNSSYPQGYVSWKGRGIFSNPVGNTSGHVRPLTNKDPGNIFQTGFGLPRPIKHFRKGRFIPPFIKDEEANEDQFSDFEDEENALIKYNIYRYVKSSKGQSLGGGSGGYGLLNQMMDSPGGFLIKQNLVGLTDKETDYLRQCYQCQSVPIISNYQPNTAYLTDNPQKETQTPKFCCNEERKAKRRVVYASTNLKKNYYTTHTQYLQNRCKTYDQKAFNFVTPNPVITQEIMKQNPDITPAKIALAKPGSALALYNTYFANCFPNGEIYDTTEEALVSRLVVILETKNILTPEQVKEFQELGKINFDELYIYIEKLPEPQKTDALYEFSKFITNPYIGVPFSGPSNRVGCKLTVYKPNNPQFAVQGAVQSSTRNLKLNVDTISTNVASFSKKSTQNPAGIFLNVNELVRGETPEIPFILKNKTTPCGIPPVNPYQTNKSCKNLGKLYSGFKSPMIRGGTLIGMNTQPPFSSNHFSQSPNTYNTNSRNS